MTSKATKRKYVIDEVLNDFVLPEDNQQIVKVLASCGSNLHQVRNGEGSEFLVSMPTKFRRNVWIKKNDFVIVTAIEEGDKVKAEITTILYKEQIKYVKDSNMWPEAFITDKDTEVKSSAPIDDDMLPPTYSASEDSGSEDNADDLAGAGNPNRLYTNQLDYANQSNSESDLEADV